jgi:hypothetical protein
MSTKNYNRIFLTLTRTLRRDGTSPAKVREYLQGLTGDSSEWPTDAVFGNAWMTTHAYRVLQNPKIVHILRRLNQTYQHDKHELIIIDGQLTVEHLLPQTWTDHWPLPDGTKGLTFTEFLAAPPDDPCATATKERNDALQTFGNLTIITQPLNGSLSNAPWTTKRPALLNASLLPINQQLCQSDTWDEHSIAARGKELLQRAVSIWPRPQ